MPTLVAVEIAAAPIIVLAMAVVASIVCWSATRAVRYVRRRAPKLLGPKLIHRE